jgi:hypothetical protein
MIDALEYALGKVGKAATGDPLSEALKVPATGSFFPATNRIGEMAKGAFGKGSGITGSNDMSRDNWRFAGFRDMSQAYNKISYQGLLPNGLTPISSSPNAYARSPSAYHEVASSPLTLRTRTGFQSYLNGGF